MKQIIKSIILTSYYVVIIIAIATGTTAYVELVGIKISRITAIVLLFIFAYWQVSIRNKRNETKNN